MSSEPATGIDADDGHAAPVRDATVSGSLRPACLLGLLQSNDTFYPTGGYAHSFGLEGLVNDGVIRDRATLRAYLFGSVVPMLERSDLPLVARAWTAWRQPDWSDLANLSFLCAALKTVREARAASDAIGRQRAELLANLHPGPLPREYLAYAARGGWPFAAPISAALEARVFELPAEAALAGYAYTAIAGLIAAAMKLLRIGQNGAQTLLSETLATLPGRIATALTIPRADIGWFNPWLDIAAARHESADTRMFIS